MANGRQSGRLLKRIPDTRCGSANWITRWAPIVWSLSRPEILILDEPTASLDGDTGRMIIAFVKEEILNEKRCILIVTHDARINEYADRIMHMEDGRLTAFDKGTE